MGCAASLDVCQLNQRFGRRSSVRTLLVKARSVQCVVQWPVIAMGGGRGCGWVGGFGGGLAPLW